MSSSEDGVHASSGLHPLPMRMPLEIYIRILDFLRPRGEPTQFPPASATMGCDLDRSPATSPDEEEAIRAARIDLCEAMLVCRALLPSVQKRLYESISIGSARSARLLARTLRDDKERRQLGTQHGSSDASRGDITHFTGPVVARYGAEHTTLHQPSRPLHTLVEHLCITHIDGLRAAHDTNQDNLVWDESLRTVMDLCSNLRSLSVIARPRPREESTVLQQVFHPDTSAKFERLAIHSLRYVPTYFVYAY